MKIAIPLFQNRVSPRFEYAPTLLLASVENNKVVKEKEVSLTDYDLFRRCALIKELGVDTLICGGIDGFTIRLLDWRNVRVISPLSGDAEEVLKRFLQGTLGPPFTPFFPGRRHRRCQSGNRGGFRK
jgi:predicted Fe-Mo cluster-binding NifX family protein